MVALDHADQEHVQLFHQWQNDPRVSQGWNQTGTLDQHRDYLQKVHEDPHQLSILAKFDETYFAYFEVYWAKVIIPGLTQVASLWLMTCVGGSSGRVLLAGRLRTWSLQSSRRYSIPWPPSR